MNSLPGNSYLNLAIRTTNSHLAYITNEKRGLAPLSSAGHYFSSAVFRSTVNVIVRLFKTNHLASQQK